MPTNISDYEQAIEYMKKRQSLGIKPGLSRIKVVLENPLLNPQNSYKTVHIAGTNGKGTVGATIAKALNDKGYKVGLFTSPWVTSYREQIQINGNMIPKEDFTNYVKALDMMKTNCTEFELLCIIAYLYFEEQKVDYAVIECGMGGTGDATNVERKNLSVITPVSLDHTDFFGSNIEDIAREKAGILRKNCDCVLYDNTFESIFRPLCKNLIICDKSDNLSIVNTVLSRLEVKSVNELVKLPARQERIGKVLLDGGHNYASAISLSNKIYNEVAVIGMLKDKDVDGYLSLIAPKCKRIICTTPESNRAMSAAELSSYAKKYCNNVSVIENPEDAIKENDVTLICGSFYLARQVRKKLI